MFIAPLRFSGAMGLLLAVLCSLCSSVTSVRCRVLFCCQCNPGNTGIDGAVVSLTLEAERMLNKERFFFFKSPWHHLINHECEFWSVILSCSMIGARFVPQDSCVRSFVLSGGVLKVGRTFKK